MAFEFTSSVFKSPLYYIKNWRSVNIVRKSMKLYKSIYPDCAFCGRSKFIQVHHIVPLSVNPLLGGVMLNFISLCRKCHLYVGHNGNFKDRACSNIRNLCEINQVTVIKKVEDGEIPFSENVTKGGSAKGESDD